MKNPFKKEPKELELVINDVLARMLRTDPSDEEYRQLVVYLDRLMAMKTNEKSAFRVSPDTLAIVGGNLIIALIVIAYEKEHVVTTKLFGFLTKGKS